MEAEPAWKTAPPCSVFVPALLRAIVAEPALKAPAVAAAPTVSAPVKVFEPDVALNVPVWSTVVAPPTVRPFALHVKTAEAPRTTSVVPIVAVGPIVTVDVVLTATLLENAAPVAVV